MSGNQVNKPCSVLLFVLTCWFPNPSFVLLLRLLPAEPYPGFTFEVLPHSLLAASKPLSWITRCGSVSYQTGKYFTAAQGPPWIHRIRLQNNSSLYLQANILEDCYYNCRKRDRKKIYLYL
ncbi:hypothetical protein AMECASPLE_011181 [Ameca splendens]|uniref:Secreted protein n=1 Tax=Ameca splendens TaxID=208324 RepID=A0ABV0YYX9_9TELE